MFFRLAGTFTVALDDPGRGPGTLTVAKQRLKKVFSDYEVGDDCEAEYPEDGRWYPGTVDGITADGKISVRWHVPDDGPETVDLEAEKVRKVTVFRDYKVGAAIQAIFPDDGQWYPGIVAANNGDGTFQVRWDDVDGGPVESQVDPKEMMAYALSADEIKVGAKYVARVTGIKTGWGIFVDFGAYRGAFVPERLISIEPFDDINQIVEVGQEVDVWVTRLVDDKVYVSMIEGVASRDESSILALEGMRPDEWLDGYVKKILSMGCIVVVTTPEGMEADVFVHKSQISESFIQNVGDVLFEDQGVKARILNVDFVHRSAEGSLIPPGAKRYSAESEDLHLFEDVSPDTWLEASVRRVTKNGLWCKVMLDDRTAANGFVHIAEVKDGWLEDIYEDFEVGQIVKTRVLYIDQRADRLALSLREPIPDEYL